MKNFLKFTNGWTNEMTLNLKHKTKKTLLKFKRVTSRMPIVSLVFILALVLTMAYSSYVIFAIGSETNTINGVPYTRYHIDSSNHGYVYYGSFPQQLADGTSGLPTWDISHDGDTYTIGDDKYLFEIDDTSVGHWYKFAPIKWRILDIKDDSSLVLMSEDIIDARQFDTQHANNTLWDGTNGLTSGSLKSYPMLRLYLNSYDSTIAFDVKSYTTTTPQGTPYSSLKPIMLKDNHADGSYTPYKAMGFYEKAFSDAERGYILKDHSEVCESVAGNVSTEDYVRVLANAELWDKASNTSACVAYGFSTQSGTKDENRKASFTDYCYANHSKIMTKTNTTTKVTTNVPIERTNGFYITKSRFKIERNNYVDYEGTLSGSIVDALVEAWFGVRPVITLDVSKFEVADDTTGTKDNPYRYKGIKERKVYYDGDELYSWDLGYFSSKSYPNTIKAYYFNGNKNKDGNPTSRTYNGEILIKRVSTGEQYATYPFTNAAWYDKDTSLVKTYEGDLSSEFSDIVTAVLNGNISYTSQSETTYYFTPWSVLNAWGNEQDNGQIVKSIVVENSTKTCSGNYLFAGLSNLDCLDIDMLSDGSSTGQEYKSCFRNVCVDSLTVPNTFGKKGGSCESIFRDATFGELILPTEFGKGNWKNVDNAFNGFTCPEFTLPDSAFECNSASLNYIETATGVFKNSKINSLTIGNNCFTRTIALPSMFEGSEIETLTLGENFGNMAIDFHDMFKNCHNLKRINDPNPEDEEDWVIFSSNFGITQSERNKSINTTYNSYSTGVNISSMFENCENIKKIDLSNLEIWGSNNNATTFNGAINLDEIKIPVTLNTNTEKNPTLPGSHWSVYKEDGTKITTVTSLPGRNNFSEGSYVLSPRVVATVDGIDYFEDDVTTYIVNYGVSDNSISQTGETKWDISNNDSRDRIFAYVFHKKKSSEIGDKDNSDDYIIVFTGKGNSKEYSYTFIKYDTGDSEYKYYSDAIDEKSERVYTSFVDLTTPWSFAGYNEKIVKAVVTEDVKSNNWNRWFAYMPNLKDIDIRLNNGEQKKPTYMDCTFMGLSQLGPDGDIDDSELWTKFNFVNTKELKGILQATGIKSFPWVKLNEASNLQSLTKAFAGSEIESVDTSSDEIDLTNLQDAGSIFANCLNLTEVDFSGVKTGNALTALDGMFNSCENLTKVAFSDDFNIHKVANMQCMFKDTKLSNIDLSSFITTNCLTEYSEMFNGLKGDNVTINISNMDLSHATSSSNIQDVFKNSTGIKEIILPVAVPNETTLSIALPVVENHHWQGDNGSIYKNLPAAITEELTKITLKTSLITINEGTDKEKTYYPDEAIYSWDISENADGTVMAYYFNGNGTKSGCTYDGEVVICTYNASSKALDFNYLYTYDEKINNVVSPYEPLNPPTVDTYESILKKQRGFVFEGSYSFTPWNILTEFQRINTSDENIVKKFVIANQLNLKSGENFFSCQDNLEEIEGMENINTDGVTSMWQMFLNTPKIKKLDLSNFDFSAVTNYSFMLNNFNIPDDMIKAYCGWEKDEDYRNNLAEFFSYYNTDYQSELEELVFSKNQELSLQQDISNDVNDKYLLVGLNNLKKITLPGGVNSMEVVLPAPQGYKWTGYLGNKEVGGTYKVLPTWNGIIDNIRLVKDDITVYKWTEKEKTFNKGDAIYSWDVSDKTKGNGEKSIIAYYFRGVGAITGTNYGDGTVIIVDENPSSDPNSPNRLMTFNRYAQFYPDKDNKCMLADINAFNIDDESFIESRDDIYTDFDSYRDHPMYDSNSKAIYVTPWSVMNASNVCNGGKNIVSEVIVINDVHVGSNMQCIFGGLSKCRYIDLTNLKYDYEYIYTCDQSDLIMLNLFADLKNCEIKMFDKSSYLWGAFDKAENITLDFSDVNMDFNIYNSYTYYHCMGENSIFKVKLPKKILNTSNPVEMLAWLTTSNSQSDQNSKEYYEEHYPYEVFSDDGKSLGYTNVFIDQDKVMGSSQAKPSYMVLRKELSLFDAYNLYVDGVKTDSLLPYWVKEGLGFIKEESLHSKTNIDTFKNLSSLNSNLFDEQMFAFMKEKIDDKFGDDYKIPNDTPIDLNNQNNPFGYAVKVLNEYIDNVFDIKGELGTSAKIFNYLDEVVLNITTFLGKPFEKTFSAFDSKHDGMEVDNTFGIVLKTIGETPLYAVSKFFINDDGFESLIDSVFVNSISLKMPQNSSNDKFKLVTNDGLNEHIGVFGLQVNETTGAEFTDIKLYRINNELNEILVPSEDYEVSYTNNKGARGSEATLTLSGKEGGPLTGSRSYTFDLYEEDVNGNGIDDLFEKIRVGDKTYKPGDALYTWDISEVAGTEKIMAYYFDGSLRADGVPTYRKYDSEVVITSTSADNKTASFDVAIEYPDCSKPINKNGSNDGPLNMPTNKTIGDYLAKTGFINIEGKAYNCTPWSILEQLTDKKVKYFYAADNFELSNGTAFFCGLDNLVDYNIDKVKTENITSTEYMFSNCSSLEEINVNFKTNVGTLTNMASMFKGCTNVKTITFGSNFDSSGAEDMSYMFANCINTETYNLEHLDTSNCKNMEHMFDTNNSIRSINMSNFDFSNVTNMAYMFSNCHSLEDITFSTVKRTTNQTSFAINDLFKNCFSLKRINNLGNIDTSKVDDTKEMFLNCVELEEIDLSQNDFSSVKNFKDTFVVLNNVNDLAKFKDCNVDDGLISEYEQNYKVPHESCLKTIKFNSNKIINPDNYSNAFFGLTKLETLDLSSFVFTDSNSFGDDDMYHLNSLNKIILPTNVSSPTAVINLPKKDDFYWSGYNTTNETKIGTYINLPYNENGTGDIDEVRLVSLIIKVGNKEYKPSDAKYSWDISKNGDETIYAYFFDGETNKDGQHTSRKYKGELVFYAFDETKTVLPFTDFMYWNGTEKYVQYGSNGEKPYSSQYVNTIEQALEGRKFKVSDSDAITPWSLLLGDDGVNPVKEVVIASKLNYTSMQKIFAGLNSLTKITGIENIRTDNFTTCGDEMNLVFGFCSNLNSLDLSSIDFSKVKNLNKTFEGCSNLEEIIFDDDINTSNLDSVLETFSGCMSLKTIDLSNFDWDVLRIANRAFLNCSSLEELDLSKFNASNLNEMSSMFEGCIKLKGMKNANNKWELDLSGLDTSNVLYMDSMFNGCESLENIKFGTNFKTESVTNFQNIFKDCKNLTLLDLSTFTINNVNVDNFISGSNLTEIRLPESIDDSVIIPLVAGDKSYWMGYNDADISNGKLTKVKAKVPGTLTKVIFVHDTACPVVTKVETDKSTFGSNKDITLLVLLSENLEISNFDSIDKDKVYMKVKFGDNESIIKLDSYGIHPSNGDFALIFKGKTPNVSTEGEFKVTGITLINEGHELIDLAGNELDTSNLNDNVWKDSLSNVTLSTTGFPIEITAKDDQGTLIPNAGMTKGDSVVFTIDFSDTVLTSPLDEDEVLNAFILKITNKIDSKILKNKTLTLKDVKQGNCPFVSLDIGSNMYKVTVNLRNEDGSGNHFIKKDDTLGYEVSIEIDKGMLEDADSKNIKASHKLTVLKQMDAGSLVATLIRNSSDLTELVFNKQRQRFEDEKGNEIKYLDGDQIKIEGPASSRIVYKQDGTNYENLLNILVIDIDQQNPPKSFEEIGCYIDGYSINPNDLLRIDIDFIKLIIIKEGENGGLVTPVGNFDIDTNSKEIEVTVDKDFKANIYEDGSFKTALSQTGKYLIDNLQKLLIDLTVKVKFVSSKVPEPTPSGGGGSSGGGGATTPVGPTYVIVPDEKPSDIHSAYMKGFMDGTFKPNEKVSREEVATIVARLHDEYSEDYNFTSYNSFSDADDRWSKNYIGFCKMKELIHGYEDGSFHPTSFMTRAELAVLVNNFLRVQNADFENVDLTKPSFIDLDGKWYIEEVNKLAYLGILNGYEDGTFRGDNPVSRIEVAIVMNKINHRNVTKEIPEEYKIKVSQMFKDIKTNEWYFNDVAEAAIDHPIDLY